MGKSTKRVILAVCGSIAAYKAGDLVRRLQDQGCDVTVVMTAGATRFITPLTLASLSGKDVYSDMFEDGTIANISRLDDRGQRGNAWRMAHIELAKTADVFLIAPATASVIAKLAHGLADDLLTTLAITTKAPIVIAPAMNDDMYANSIVAENCAKLKKHGFKFVEPLKGKLACGVVGVGHFADVEDIVKVVVGDKD